MLQNLSMYRGLIDQSKGVQPPNRALGARPWRGCFWACVAFCLRRGGGLLAGVLLLGLPLAVHASSQSVTSVHLNDSERAYLLAHNPIPLCVDPDWWPFEVIDQAGTHQGIAADLLALVAERTGVQWALHVTRTWEESVVASKAGRCLAMSFLNRTPERDRWLIFTQPLLIDPNVLITRQEAPFISDVGQLSGKTMALPKATAMHERVLREFPNIQVLDTDSENESLGWVSERKADMTLRSLIVAADTIKHNGWFNLKISGQIPGYENRLRLGVVQSETTLRNILDKGVATLTEQDRRRVVDRHVTMEVVTEVEADYTVARWLGILLMAVVLTSAWWMRKLHGLNRQLQAMAETDALTGLPNRRGLMRSFAFDVERALRYGRPLSVIMLDIDHFKRVNDDFGHLMGDKVLVELGLLVAQTIRGVDTACRWGGEELVVVCHETPLTQAVQLAERLRQRVEAHAFAMPRPLTLSAGVADVQPRDTTDVLIARADRALYAAKEAGRNRVCVESGGVVLESA